MPRRVVVPALLTALALVGCRPAAEQPAEPGPAPTSAATSPTPASPVELLRQGVETAGWTIAGEPEVFDGEAIYDYMNGEGEIPVACGYQSLATADITGPADAGARIELFAMGTAANAFGLYSLRREPEDDRVELTHPAVLAPGQLTGWKGSYTYVVRADDPAQLEEDSLLVLAKGLEQAIPEPGALPDLVKSLPTDGLVAGSSRFFHGKFALDTIWFAAENVLQVSTLTDCAAASYTAPQGRLLVITYPPQADPAAALAAWATLTSATDDGAGHWLSKDGTAGAMLVDRRLVLAWECAGPEDVVALLKKLRTSVAAPAGDWPEA